MSPSRPAVRPIALLLSVLVFADAPLLAVDMGKGGPKGVNLGLPAQAVQRPVTAAPAGKVPTLGTTAIPAAAPAVTGAVQAQAAAAGAEGTGVERVSSELGGMSERLSAATEAAGDPAKGSDEAAKSLGAEGEKAVTGESAAAAPATWVPAAASAKLTQEQTKKLRALNFVTELFTEHYAPVDWKKLGRSIDFVKNYKDIRAQIEQKPDMTQTQFRGLLKGFVDAIQDYHVSIGFYATEASKLPLTIVSADGRYFIYDIDRDKLPESKFPYKRGDEVLTFDGKPVAEVAKSLLPAIENTQETDARLTDMFLTARSARKAMEVPQGQAKLQIKTSDGAAHDVAVDWVYRKEDIPQELATGGENLGPESADPFAGVDPAAIRQGSKGLLASLKKKVREFMAPMVQTHPETDFLAEMTSASGEHGFTLGARKSFVPELGKVIWPSSPREQAQMERLPFHAYIYENDQGQKVGFVRISDYMAGGNPQAAAQVFAALIKKFQQETDALVIDQVNNPGGNMFYTYALLSMLSDKPLKIPQHFMMIDQSDGKMASEIIRESEQPSVKKLLQQAIADEMLGFAALPTEQENPVVTFARYVLERLRRAQDEKNPKLLLTELIDLFGVSQIDPQPMVHYTKPIVVLINELDFSGGDFFPAILKDNNRATLFGVRTSGAGGAVKSQSWANRFGIEMISYTWTLAMRTIGQVIENLGVTPDVQYQLKAEDLQNGFQSYKKAVNDTVKNKLVSARLAAPQANAAAGPNTAPDAGPQAAPAAAASRFILRSPVALDAEQQVQVKLGLEQAGIKVIDQTPTMLLVEGDREVLEQISQMLGWTLTEEKLVPRPDERPVPKPE
jgi:C-terminal processing protease CtpA/Prc